LLFPLSTYPALKKAFDAIHERDRHAITHRQQAANRLGLRGKGIRFSLNYGPF
jgi:hypothetical protein